ncbi:MAG: DNA internalization-related competence protein ComEC/Rec2 [Desulfitobacteriia bacterium]
MRDKLTRPAVAIILGVVMAVYCKQEVRIWVLALLILGFWGLIAFWKPKDFWGKISRPEVLLLAVGVLSGFLYGLSAEKIILKPYIQKNIQVEGCLSTWSIDQQSGQGIIVLDEQFRKEFSLGDKYTLRVFPKSDRGYEKGWEQVQAGDRLRIRGKLEHPSRPGTKGQFDLPLYNAVRGLSGTITATGEVLILERGRTNLAWSIRQKIRQNLMKYWPEEAGILEGILFGDKRGIPVQALEMYKATGVMHVFAASGANVAFVIALVWTLFFFLPKKYRTGATLAVMVLYAALCQGNPPILRATILGAIVLSGRLGRGKVPSLRWLTYVALILIIYRPLYVKDVSFQLSFIATGGILVLGPLLEKLKGLRRLPQPFNLAAAVALGAQIAILPILIEVFHRVSLAGFITNVFMIFFLGIVLQLGLLGCFFLWFPALSFIFFQTAFWVLKAVNVILDFVASLPGAYFWVLNPGFLFWIIWYGALFFFLEDREKLGFILRVQLRRIKGLLLKVFPRWEGLSRENGAGILKCKKGQRYLAFGLVILFFFYGAFVRTPARMTVTFLDVGQGDCIIIQTAREQLVVDTGFRTEKFDAGERILLPYLMENRVGSLDMVFITHEDSDHLGGARSLLTNLPVQVVAIPELTSEVEILAWEEGIPSNILYDPDKLKRLKAGDRINFSSGLNIEVLAPVYRGGNSENPNRRSLVLLLSYLGVKILLTGDLEMEEMQEIRARGVPWDADFLKIPHHGSKGSLDPLWFDETNPQAVFISVGANSYGHPAPEVLAYWEERGIPVFRTDLHGTIILEIDNRGATIFPGRK